MAVDLSAYPGVAVCALVAVPLIVGLLLLIGGRYVPALVTKVVTALVAVATVALTALTWVAGDSISAAWIPGLKVNLALGLDGISAPLVALTAGAAVVVAAHLWVELPEGGPVATYAGLALLVVGGALLVFTARDAIVFFIGFETVLVPMWALIARFGDASSPPERRFASTQFALFTVSASMLILIAIVALVSLTGTAAIADLGPKAAGLSSGLQLFLALLLVIGFAIKIPIVPLHVWLPPAHTIAPTTGSVLLAAVLLKLGTYGLVRFPVAMLPEAFATLAPFLAVFGVVGIIWGGLVCLVERDLKRLIAYSSIAHMGFVVLGIASGSQVGLQAALFANVAHGVISAFLFVLVGGLKRRWGSTDLDMPRAALREVAPRLGFFTVLGFAAGLGLPGLIGFWGEFLAIYSAIAPDPDRPRWVFLACAAAASVGAALAGAYSVRVLRTVWVGDRATLRASRAMTDTSGVEAILLSALGLVMLAGGVLPGALLSVTASSVARLGGGS